MTDIQNIILILTAIVSVVSLSLGIMNFSINVKNRRNSIREKVFDKQLELFLEFNSLMGDIMDKSNSLWHPKIKNNDEISDELDDLVDELDEKLYRNDIIIPDELDSNFTVLLNLLNNSLSGYYQDKNSFTVETRNKINSAIIDIYFDIEDYMAIENLSKENMRISRGKRIESRLNLEEIRRNKTNR